MKRFVAGITFSAVIVSLLLLMFLPAVAGAVYLRTYTVDADFAEGTLNGVQYTDNPDELQLTETPTTLPFIWVANSGEATVSKIRTSDGVELGRYRTGPGGEDPSRTTVDANGDLWVGNRATGTAVKIALYPEDTTGGESPARPDIFTPADSVPDGILNTSTGAGDVKPWGTDDAVLMRVTAPWGTRALAIDANNNCWIGGRYASPNYPMECRDGETGALLDSVNIGRQCYGALIDGNGTLWVSNIDSRGMTRVDDLYGAQTVTWIPTPDGGHVYGLGIDTDGYIYCSGWTDSRIRKYDPVTNTWVWWPNYWQLYQGRGVCVDNNGNVWVASSYYHHMCKINKNTGALITTVGVGTTPTGASVDAAGKVWTTCISSNTIHRIDPVTHAVDSWGGHYYPYNYSDMTGIISRSITTKTGTWNVDSDSGVVDADWATVFWSSNEPAGTSITVRVRSSNDQSSWSAWETTTSGMPLSATPNGRYLQVETTLKITSGDTSPILYDLTVNADTNACPPIPELTPVVLFGVGLVGVIGYLGFRRLRKGRVQVIAS